ncbi:hypothetical protein UFOVP128_59 [uncultured Caudovirales phage]|uniref:Uncharacterized protein n=1 Tax=uncultured Caudovirales phage TaxID=2100421 RepID=A0A6J5LDT7_9CAUD|nr:hypothetical protein UFOVP128_59 [uncultured Caudovirales phage]CAB5222091.1 hypothetical protein UFOVP243_60 [uncultured Caudovirales phage]
MKEEFDALFAEHQKLLGELQAMRALAKPEQKLDYKAIGQQAYESGYSTGYMDCAVKMKAKPEQEPVAVVTGVYGGRFTYAPFKSTVVLPVGAALYLQPPQRTWVGLTLEDKEEYLALDFGGNRLDAMDWAARKLKEKNT